MKPYKPPIPPKAAALMPDDPFEQWLAVQALAGHDRNWLRRNKVPLRERWERDQSNLKPPIPEPSVPKDRYTEL